MAYYYNHRFLVTPVAGYEDRYQEFCSLMEVCCKEKDGNEFLCKFLGDPDEWHVYLRGVYGREETRYKPVVTDDHCEFFMWSRYTPEYLAAEMVEDIACSYCVSIYKVYGEEDRDEDGAGFVHVEFIGEELDEGGDVCDVSIETEFAFFDQHDINFDESYHVKDASGQFVSGGNLLGHDSVTYAQLTKMLRALAWKNSVKMPERGITSLAASNMSQMVKVIEAIIREQVSKDL